MEDSTYPLQPVETTAAPVREKLVSSIREAIFRGWYSPGQRLIEREICESTGVSRTSVREALRQLETEGLVDMVPNRGAVVATVTLSGATELYEIRAALEGLAGRLCARKVTERQLAELRVAADRLRAAVAADEPNDLLAAKDHFYARMFEGAANEVMMRMLTGLHGRITLLRSRTLTSPGRPKKMLEELEQILSAIEARDEDAAAEACAAHVASASAVALETLRRQLPAD